MTTAKSHTDLEDEGLVTQLEAGTLAPALFNHEAHIRIGYLYLCDGNFTSALDRMRQSLTNFTIIVGAEGKYHETITAAYLALINEHLQRDGDAGGWPGFIAQHPDLLASDLLSRYYDSDILKSDLARSTFVLPKLAA
jgi:hypothetical protein